MIGYEYLLSRIPRRMPPLRRPARVRPVTRVERMPDLLAVPRHVAPAEGATLLDHVLFALKHESLRLDVFHEALRLVPADDRFPHSAWAAICAAPPSSGRTEVRHFEADFGR